MKLSSSLLEPWMRHQAVTASSLPSLMMPCPVCAGRMAYRGRRAVSAEMEDTVYACRRCGAELVRSSIRQAANPGAEAA
jgi:DNA-directed RNA polymerase subunit RPC12/RpoP